jgi:hypothetical protein
VSRPDSRAAAQTGDTAPDAVKQSSRDVVEERWVYGGIRVLDNKRVHAWIDPSGRELLYAHKRSGTWAVGSFYTARVTRNGPHTTLYATPSYHGDGYADTGLRRRLWAQDTAARARLALVAQERNAARRNAIDEALMPLLDVARTLKTGADRDAFTAYVIRQLAAAWYTLPTGDPS